ncbi:DUF481 domain-containing protein [Psychromonas aquatilis]|uniref:DUF481 domain-containing protein n=1 Tax=Psychromonas aquatilis TaxID=2005072 RepID=A0ABU9GMK4_9GAMM
MKKLLVSVAIASTLPLHAYAKSDFVEGDATFGGEAELGATLTTGNTETSSIKGRLALKHELGNWENSYTFAGLYQRATEDDVDSVTAKRYAADLQGNYQLDDLSYLFVTTNYEVDEFSGYDFSSTSAAGYGHRFIDNETMSLNAEIGPGYIYQEYDDENKALLNETHESSAVAHMVVDFQSLVGESAKFQQKFIADWGSKLDASSETSLSANIVGSLAMKFAVVVSYNSDPLEGIKSTDTETNLTLLYGF